jgi:hypothetical protein
MGGLADAGLWGVARAMFAAIAGLGLAVAAIAFGRRLQVRELLEFEVGYDMLAPMLDALTVPNKI